MPITAEELEKIVRSAGSLALRYFQDVHTLEINKKSARDLVTDADVAVEKYLQEKLREHCPEFGFWGEESGQSENQLNRWIVDPIDGTHSFSKGQYFWAISVALEIENQLSMAAVYAPALNDYYAAERHKGSLKNGRPIRVSNETRLADSMVATGFACLRSYLQNNNLQRFCRIAEATTGQRRFGSAALDLCLVADGQVDAFWEQELNLYDVAAGALIAQEAGASLTDFSGKEGIFPKQILATNGKILDQILELM
jgi:myo-inositol-1(or 4)-monophosphatase